jgi:hypothetical protein
MVLLPVAIGTRLEGAAAPVRAGVNRALAAGAAVVVAVVVAVLLTRDEPWFERSWPSEALPAVEDAAADPGVRVFATDRHADWLLWKIPELRGRVAYDVRFELYDALFFDELLAYKARKGDWKRIVDGYEIVVLDGGSTAEHAEDFLAESGARTLYEDDVIAVVRRPASS